MARHLYPPPAQNTPAVRDRPERRQDIPLSPGFPLKRLNTALLLALAGTANAQTDAAPTLKEVVVSASRQEQQSFDAPVSIQAVGRDESEAAGPRVNLSESLNRVLGITVRNRQNYARDLQLSIRGSGSRSAFGIRGARLIVDGIPATMPDGQGQASTISLPSARRFKVLRGPPCPALRQLGLRCGAGLHG